eukprot:GHVQ01025868.1.p1 GENE.GHVQ01025868.1~~GHVQ01025868.1.p1  ORF type:complete len:241 (-),score=11.34 GHVQ01025868.1:2599-3255(-)
MAGLATATCTVRGIRGSLAKRFSALPVTQISRGNDIFFFSIATSVQITKPPSHPIGFLDTILQRLQGCGQPLTYSRATAEILDHVRQTQINDFGSLIKILHGFSVANYWPVGLFEAAACVIQMNGQHLDYTQWSDALVAFAIPQFYHQEMIITCLQYICECSTKEGDMLEGSIMRACKRMLTCGSLSSGVWQFTMFSPYFRPLLNILRSSYQLYRRVC